MAMSMEGMENLGRGGEGKGGRGEGEERGLAASMEGMQNLGTGGGVRGRGEESGDDEHGEARILPPLCMARHRGCAASRV